MRVGIGYDVHPFAGGREMWLGCVQIPSERGLLGHSDADVLAHAIADALLGAAALGDIGTHFPAEDPQWEGVPGFDLLAHVRAQLDGAGFAIVNVDGMVVMEEPRIGAHRDQMRARIGEALGIDASRVGVKATSNDRMGYIGRGEGAAAMAVALIEEAS